MFNILVVDDDKNTRIFMRAVLEAEGYTVFTACNGEEALALMDKEHVDLAVLDVMMPKMDGYQFTESLRECENDLPILMVSAKQMPEDKRKGFLVGTDDYMTKPIDEVELLLRIKALLRRAKIATERRIVIGDITLDYDNFTAKDEAALRRLSSMGDDIWENRQKNPTMLHALVEWTEKYSKICDTVNGYGF